MYFSLSHEFKNTIIKKVITKDKILCYFDKFFLLFP